MANVTGSGPGPQTREFNRRNGDGFQWRLMVPDGNPASLRENEVRLAINVRLEDGQIATRGGQEKVYEDQIGAVRGMIDTPQAVSQRNYLFMSTAVLHPDGVETLHDSAIAFLDPSLPESWALHSAEETGTFDILGPDVFGDELVWTGTSDVWGLWGSGEELWASTGFYSVPLSSLLPLAQAPFGSTSVEIPGSKAIGPIVVRVPRVVYAQGTATTPNTPPTEQTRGCRVHDSNVLIFIQRRPAAPAVYDLFCDVWNGSEITGRETMLTAQVAPISLAPAFAERWHDNMIVGFDDSLAAAPNMLLLRPPGDAGQTWTPIVPGAGSIMGCRGARSFQGDLYILAKDGATQGKVWKYDGTTLAVTHTIPDCSQMLYGVITNDGGRKLVMAYVRLLAGVYSMQLAMFDGTTWNDTYKDITAAFTGNPDQPGTQLLGGSPTDFPQIAESLGGAVIVAGNSVGGQLTSITSIRAHWSNSTDLTGTWRKSVDIGNLASANYSRGPYGRILTL